MAYFPMFVELKNKNVLIVGGGKVALRKLERLLPYGPYITVAAPQVDDELLSAGAADFILEPFSARMLRNQAMVIAATDDRKLNHKIAALCRDKKIPVNVVDDRDECSFIFPALFSRGQLSIGVSTGGASPTAAVWCRDRIEEMLPESLPKLIEYLDSMRPMIMEKLDSEEKRSRVFKAMFSRCLELGRELDSREIDELMENCGHE